MGTQPDELKSDVENTRARLAHNVDRLADKAAPGKVARRKAEATQRRITRVKERVMGAASDTTASGKHGITDAAEQAGDAARHTADQVGQTVRQAPDRVTRQTQGSPMAAGIIAFGAGMLAAALLPTTSAEERVGAQLREYSDELLEPVKQTAQDVKKEMRGPATEAVEAVKSTAQDAAQTTRQKAQDAGQETGTGLREVGQDAARQAGG
ncbi:DUF3618 domain-containing protein [Streptomyces sp. OspMP-M43]|uniref:DUF3618 domain-containing protein n=1 Tax=Streptomyces sp. OspMP-M43 TaxID=1839781 RepID=UPI00081B6769|nr:DUF3618 domain-containing protein [Streptomyces sp. OspMP-M43]SCE16300.1 Protein of unknown function [Streptomyces sp. OspMP-M43]